MKEGLVDVDGRQFAPEEARVSAFDRGFLYGDSAFEVLRTYGGRAFRLTDHLERLRRSCERILIEPPLSDAELARRVESAIVASGLGDCYLRVVITRGVGPLGLDIAQLGPPSVLIYAMPLALPPPEVYERGIAAGLCRVTRTTDGTIAVGAKTSNYLSSVLALAQVRQRGCHEALIVGADDQVVEGATSNVFAVTSGEVVTPPASAGILEGITRRTIIELCAERGITCRERELSCAELCGSDEVFITSSIRELVPVVRIDDHIVGDGEPGPIARGLLQAYRERTG